GLTGGNKKKIIFICLTRLYNKMIKLSELRNFLKKKLLSVNPWCPREDYSLTAQNIYNFKVGVGIQSKVAWSKYTHCKKMKFMELKLNDSTFNNYQ
ncbi:MAG: hypothetical protein MJE68_00330, partial [Proteobacteria bacterium]|nr:hypothetical protein [Pseudomonadota bacterium]